MDLRTCHPGGKPGRDAGLALPLVLITMTALLTAAALLLDHGRNALQAGQVQRHHQAALYAAEAGLQEAVARVWQQASGGGLAPWLPLAAQPVQACFAGEGCALVGTFDLQQLHLDEVAMTTTVLALGRVEGQHYELRAELAVVNAGLPTQHITIRYLNG